MDIRIPSLAAALCLSLGGCAATGADRPMEHIHHTIDYIELSVTDLAEAKRFYGEAFGWQFNDYGPEYAGIQRAGGGEVGGLSTLSEVVRGGPLLVLYSEDLEASLAAVERAGGRIVTQPFAFPGGRRFQFLDPAGNELAVATYE